MELAVEQDTELRALISSRDVSAAVATRARVVLWHAEGRARKDIGALAGLEEYKRGGGRVQVPPEVRARIVAISRSTRPQGTRLSRWSCRLLADCL